MLTIAEAWDYLDAAWLKADWHQSGFGIYGAPIGERIAQNINESITLLYLLDRISYDVCDQMMEMVREAEKKEKAEFCRQQAAKCREPENQTEQAT